MEYRLPGIVVEDGALRIVLGKRGGFQFNGSDLVIELEPINDIAATSETPRRGRPPKNESEGA